MGFLSSSCLFSSVVPLIWTLDLCLSAWCCWMHAPHSALCLQTDDQVQMPKWLQRGWHSPNLCNENNSMWEVVILATVQATCIWNCSSEQACRLAPALSLLSHVRKNFLKVKSASFAHFCLLQVSYIGSTQCLKHSVLSCGLPDSLQDRGKSKVILLDSLTS